MFKKIIYLFLIFFVSLSLAGCKTRDAIILFNKEPITKENLENNATEFPAGKRFYYIFITQTRLKSDMIRIRLLKRDPKVEHEITTLFYSNDFKLRKDQIYYYNDYLVINTPGEYYMEIYDRYALRRPIATADFRIKN